MPLVSPTQPDRLPLLGAQACALGAFEAGARLATGYPGTPATPALEYLFGYADDDLRVEWAVNEKVALEVAAGHSWSGQRSFVTMKMSGLNVASDALLAIATSGTVGGLVLYVGDDPGAYYGMVEQDSRLTARLGFLPMVEPGTPDEGRGLVLDAFRVSEEAETPVLVRGTTTTANTCEPVEPGERERGQRRSGFPHDIDRFTKAGTDRCLRQHAAALDRLARAGVAFDRWNRFEPGTSRLGIVAPASVWGYVEEAVAARCTVDLPHRLRLVVVHPLPDARLRDLLERCDRVLVVEELDPLIEERVRALAAELPHRPTVLGKGNGLFSEVGDLDPDTVTAAVDTLRGAMPPTAPAAPDPVEPERWARRTLTFCPGCPHRSAFVALERAIRKAGLDSDDVVVTGDVGCTILGMNPPHDLCRTEGAMGSSIAVAQGAAYANPGKKVVATIGDGTFFHAGIPPLLHAATQDVDLTVLVLDNHHAAMTGYQPSVGNSYRQKGGPKKPVRIQDLARACGVTRVRKAWPFLPHRLTRALTRALRSPGVQVVISEGPCTAKRPYRTVVPYRVKPDRCVGIRECEAPCIARVGCPAVDRDPATGRAVIDEAACLGCGLCSVVCQPKAIGRRMGGWRRT